MEQPPASSTSQSVESGAFLASALSARNEGRLGLVTIMAGWDQARGGRIFDTTAEAELLGPVSLIAGAVYDGPGTSTSPHFDLRLDVTRQATHGLDMAVSVGYAGAGFSTVPSAVLKVAMGRSVGASYVLANVAYEQGLEEGERSGELRLAALRPVSSAAVIGVDSRLQIDLERDASEPVGETEWEWRSSLVASYTWNRIVFTGGGGLSALRFRAGGPMEVGPVVTAGFGTLF
ncbi:MAG TPA: hypothetical protein VFT22_36575 [Kofleriaceae bacterium]|nr:hypothetical protein [Kofleriaceae bacterium]